jgi:hypothetical protein
VESPVENQKYLKGVLPYGCPDECVKVNYLYFQRNPQKREEAPIAKLKSVVKHVYIKNKEKHNDAKFPIFESKYVLRTATYAQNYDESHPLHCLSAP